MTWGEFKVWMAERGVADTDTIAYIDFNASPIRVARYEGGDDDALAWRFYVE